jgi:hypothetical protein
MNLKPGGGGGGGYFGGGSGGSGGIACVAGGGGGGSSFAAPSASNAKVRDDTTGVAEVVITPGPATKEEPKSSIDFSFGKLTRNKRKGTARLAVILPGPGRLSLKGKGIVAKQLSIQKAGTAMLPIKVKGRAKRRLLAKGRAKLKASITFSPSGDGPIVKTRAIKLIKN